MPANKIMLIRHAEKPEGDDAGVSAEGEQNDKELIVRGWQRSGGLVRLFAPRNGTFVDPHLAQPKIIFASGVGKHSDSLRPQHTVLELATALGLTLQTKYLKGDEADLAKAAVAPGLLSIVAAKAQRRQAAARVNRSTALMRAVPPHSAAS